jgi:hypothetical protein
MAIMTTGGVVHLPLAFAAAPPQGGDPHGEFGVTPSSGDPHSSVAPKGDSSPPPQKEIPHLCESAGTGGSGSSGTGGGKVVITQC